MAHSCVSTPTASLRLKSPVFSSAKPSSFPSSQTLVVPFDPLRSRKLRELAGNQQHVRKSPLKAIYDGERSSRSGLWSIRDDLETPASPYFSVSAQGQGPSLMVLERFQSVINQLFQHRIIRCGGPVDDDMANMIVAQLLYLDAIDPGKDIVMYVNSPGGNVTSGMAVFDTMKHIRPDVSTVCAGIAASMAAFLLAAGTKGKRFSLPNARIMIHQPLGALEGFLTEISVQYDEVLHHKANMCSYLAYYTGQSLDKITEDTCYDFFMSAEEAVEYGLIDGVITNPLGALPPLAAGADQ